MCFGVLLFSPSILLLNLFLLLDSMVYHGWLSSTQLLEYNGLVISSGCWPAPQSACQGKDSSVLSRTEAFIFPVTTLRRYCWVLSCHTFSLMYFLFPIAGCLNVSFETLRIRKKKSHPGRGYTGQTSVSLCCPRYLSAVTQDHFE